MELLLVKKEDIKRSCCLDCYRTMEFTDGRMEDGRISNSRDVFDDFAAALRVLSICNMATVYSY